MPCLCHSLPELTAPCPRYLYSRASPDMVASSKLGAAAARTECERVGGTLASVESEDASIALALLDADFNKPSPKTVCPPPSPRHPRAWIDDKLTTPVPLPLQWTGGLRGVDGDFEWPGGTAVGAGYTNFARNEPKTGSRRKPRNCREPPRRSPATVTSALSAAVASPPRLGVAQ